MKRVHRITFELPGDLNGRFRDICDAHGLSIATVMRSFVEELVFNHDELRKCLSCFHGYKGECCEEGFDMPPETEDFETV